MARPPSVSRTRRRTIDVSRARAPRHRPQSSVSSVSDSPTDGGAPMASRFETIRYEKAGAIATLTMSRPERRNGMTNQMLCEATEALAAAAEDPELRVLVLTG